MNDNLEYDKEIERWIGFYKTITMNEEWKPNFPREAIWKKGTSTLWHYEPGERNGRIPLFLLYSHINKPGILDLTKEYSMIGQFLKEGYDVYLYEFGEPSFEDRSIGLEKYLFEYIDHAFKQTLQHSGQAQLSFAGFCLGGTLAAMYASLRPDLIKNLLLFVTPIDFQTIPEFSEWIEALKIGDLDIKPLIQVMGTIPSSIVRAGMRLLTSPVYLSPYLSLLAKSYDPDHAYYWYRFNQWTNDHIPMTGAFALDLIELFVKRNALVNGGLELGGNLIDLKNIKSNLYMISSQYDHMVPADISSPLLNIVSSSDKHLEVVEGGHASLIKNSVPQALKEWLQERS
ncbi:alpha/beta fold hydrolase [Bacillus haikouensis]|uniref:alpha/beta fold hydrolase n=1 Tax=Bacillus haikouensis TaxID=1510468 RepID=UPI001555834B|nr:alpha/beta fold hydrolase [Bacillus haikouensis]NQD66188.1 alpha/beta fold hydrolase [Bacillus haikouensis]